MKNSEAREEGSSAMNVSLHDVIEDLYCILMITDAYVLINES